MYSVGPDDTKDWVDNYLDQLNSALGPVFSFPTVYKLKAGWDCELWGRQPDLLTSDRPCWKPAQCASHSFQLTLQPDSKQCFQAVGLTSETKQLQHVRSAVRGRALCVSTAGEEALVSTVIAKTHSMWEKQNMTCSSLATNCTAGQDRADSEILEVCRWENKALMSFGVQACLETHVAFTSSKCEATETPSGQLCHRQPQPISSHSDVSKSRLITKSCEIFTSWNHPVKTFWSIIRYNSCWTLVGTLRTQLAGKKRKRSQMLY